LHGSEAQWILYCKSKEKIGFFGHQVLYEFYFLVKVSAASLRETLREWKSTNLNTTVFTKRKIVP
jgi:hypothetical protein